MDPDFIAECLFQVLEELNCGVTHAKFLEGDGVVGTRLLVGCRMDKLQVWVFFAFFKGLFVTVSSLPDLAKFIVDHPNVIVGFRELRAEDLSVPVARHIFKHTPLEMRQRGLHILAHL